MLQNIWTTRFKIKKGNVVSFLVQLIIFLVGCAIAGAVIGLLSDIPVVGVIFAILGSLMGVYSLVGVVLCILKFLDIV